MNLIIRKKRAFYEYTDRRIQMEASADDYDAGTMVLPVMTTVSTQTDDYDTEDDGDDDDDADNDHYIDLQSEDTMQEIYDERLDRLEVNLLENCSGHRSQNWHKYRKL